MCAFHPADDEPSPFERPTASREATESARSSRGGRRWDYRHPSPIFLFVQIIADADDDDVLAEEEAESEEPAGGVVQEAVPPARGDEFGKDHGDEVIIADPLGGIQVAHERGDELAIRRIQDDERHIGSELLPILP